MHLPFSTGGPFDDLESKDRTPVRSNIKPKTYDYLFRELLPFRGCQGEIIAHLLEKLCLHLQSRHDIGNYTKPDGTVHGIPDPSYAPTIARAIESFDFRLPDSGSDRPADGEHDTGTTERARDGVASSSHESPDIKSQVTSSEGIRRLANKIFAGSD